MKLLTRTFSVCAHGCIDEQVRCICFMKYTFYRVIPEGHWCVGLAMDRGHCTASPAGEVTGVGLGMYYFQINLLS